MFLQYILYIKSRVGNSLTIFLIYSERSASFLRKNLLIAQKNEQFAPSLIFGKQPEWFTQVRSFLVSDQIKSLTVAHLIWAMWGNEWMSDEQMSEFPTLKKRDRDSCICKTCINYVLCRQFILQHWLENLECTVSWGRTTVRAYLCEGLPLWGPTSVRAYLWEGLPLWGPTSVRAYISEGLSLWGPTSVRSYLCEGLPQWGPTSVRSYFSVGLPLWGPTSVRAFSVMANLCEGLPLRGPTSVRAWIPSAICSSCCVTSNSWKNNNNNFKAGLLHQSSYGTWKVGDFFVSNTSGRY